MFYLEVRIIQFQFILKKNCILYNYNIICIILVTKKKKKKNYVNNTDDKINNIIKFWITF